MILWLWLTRSRLACCRHILAVITSTQVFNLYFVASIVQCLFTFIPYLHIASRIPELELSIRFGEHCSVLCCGVCTLQIVAFHCVVLQRLAILWGINILCKKYSARCLILWCHIHDSTSIYSSPLFTLPHYSVTLYSVLRSLFTCQFTFYSVNQ